MSVEVSRRWLLTATGAVGLGAALGACTSSASRPRPSARLIEPTDPAVSAAETRRARAATGRTVSRTLRARPVTIDLGGRQVRTWAYDDTLPGPAIRLRVGDRLRVNLVNALPQPTSVHWHGLEIRNDMDGVPGLTQKPVRPVIGSNTSSWSRTPAHTGSTPMRAHNWTGACTHR